jgi:hypothetical protein
MCTLGRSIYSLRVSGGLAQSVALSLPEVHPAGPTVLSTGQG